MRPELSLLLGGVVAELATLFLLYQTGRGGKAVRTWYKRYGVGAYAIDILSAVFCVCVAREIVLSLLKKKEDDPSFFLLLCSVSVAIQMAHDLLFGAWLRGYEGDSPILLLFKEYASEVGATILVADALIILCTCLVFHLSSSGMGHGPGLAAFSLSAYTSLLLVHSF